MRLSIRARLTAWYATVVVIAFATGTIAIAQVQGRVARNRLDAELTRLVHTVTAVLHNEFGEGLDLPGAVKEASVEVIAEGRTIAVIDAGGALLGAWGNRLPAGWRVDLLSADGSSVSRATIDRLGLRAVASRVSDGGRTFVVAVLAPLDALERERNQLLRALAIGTIVALIVAIAGGWLVGRHAIEPAALHAQQQFMADASHQLRTPVSIIRTTAQVILRKEQRSEAEYRESTTIVAEQSARLTRLVDAMFLLSRADAGGRALRTSELYLDELLADCVRGLGVLAAARQVELEMAGDTDILLCGDEELLRQMLLNLLDNAIRHTPASARVRTTLRAAGGAIEVRVEDQGPGIPAADRDRVFQRFVRLDHSSEGAGLGLPMARWIAEAHGGSLTLESSGPGGSCFTVRLPRQE